MSDLRTRIKTIISLLTREYGKREWKLDKDTVGVLVRTILSQNTSDRNSDRAFDSLKKAFPSWVQAKNASEDKLAESIKHGGLSEVKARYIKDSLNHIFREQGNLNLDLLKGMATEEARKWLLHLPGVGLKTANVVLLFSLGVPVLPVDTHVFRVTKRLGLIEKEAKIETVSDKLEPYLPPDQVYAFHVLIIEHGRKVCVARHPKCRICVLGNMCPSYAFFTSISG